MPTKAKNAAPWTKKKLFKYRQEQQKRREQERKEQKVDIRQFSASGAEVDRALRGCGE